MTETIILPVNLRYVNEAGDLVTQLPIDACVEYLSKLLEVLTTKVNQNTSLLMDVNSDVVNLQEEFPIDFPVLKVNIPDITGNNLDTPIEDVVHQIATILLELKQRVGLITDATTEYEAKDWDNEYSLTQNTVKLSEYSQWNTDISDESKLMSNVLIIVKDMWEYLKNFSSINANCNDVNINYNITVTKDGILFSMYGYSTIPNDFSKDNNSKIKIEDNWGNVIYTSINVVELSRNSGSKLIPFTGLHPTSSVFKTDVSYNISSLLNACTGVIHKETIITDSGLCPTTTVNIQPSNHTFISINSPASPITIKVTIVDPSAPSVILWERLYQDNTQIIITEEITGLSEQTSYSIKTEVLTSPTDYKLCNTQTFTTSEIPSTTEG